MTTSWFAYLIGAGVVGVVLVWGFRGVARALRPLPDDGVRRCPHCGHEFEGTRRYCLACGGQVWDDVLPKN